MNLERRSVHARTRNPGPGTPDTENNEAFIEQRINTSPDNSGAEARRYVAVTRFASFLFQLSLFLGSGRSPPLHSALPLSHSPPLIFSLPLDLPFLSPPHTWFCFCGGSVSCLQAILMLVRTQRVSVAVRLGFAQRPSSASSNC